MKPAAEALRGRLATIEFAAPRIPVLNNIDVALETEPSRIREALVRQAAGPVRWVESVQALKARGVTAIIECGPGRVLAGMAKRIAPDLVAASVYDPATLAETHTLLSTTA
jgi:[acyl-carrier-protein] S-malonyltransferase